MTRPAMHRPRPPAGFGALAAILVLVVLSALAAAVLRLGWSSQSGMALDVTSARALRAANAGIEWGLFQAFKGSWTACSGASATLDLRNDAGVRVTVTCNSTAYVEGQDSAGADATVRVYAIEAVACNGSAATCPDNSQATTLNYVERRRAIQATN